VDGLIWSPEVLRGIHDVCTFLSRTSESYARALRLPAQPRLGAKGPECDRDDLRELQVRTHRLLYRIRGDDIEIIALVNASRHLPRTPPD
jgi:plasmid stabilization system protein ParE